MKRHGFTLIEVLTVVSIIAILAGLLVIGVGKLQTTAKRRQTEQVMANAQAIFDEYRATTGQIFGSGPIDCAQNLTTGMVPTGLNSSYGRFSNPTVTTRDFMWAFSRLPNNQAALNKLPADEKMTIPATLVTTTSDWPTFPPYYIGKKAGNGSVPDQYFRRIALYAPTGSGASLTLTPDTAAQAPPNAAYWIPAPPPNTAAYASVGTYTTPMLLDGWGNPILFVPGGMLGQYATGSYTAGTPVTGGDIVAGGQYTQVISPGTAAPGGLAKPFFASAGPDGDLSHGDDNLYSFEH